MKKRNFALIAAVAVSAAGLFTSVSAADSTTTVDAGGKKGGCATGHCGPRGGKGGFVKALGITDDQLEKLNTIKLDYSKATAPKKAELMTLSKEMRDDMTKPGVTKSQMLQLQGKINEIKSALSMSRVEFMADRMAVLTDDQKAKIRSFALKRSFGPGHHGGGHHFKSSKKFHHGGGRFKGPGPRSFRGDKPAAFSAPPAAPAAPEAPNQV